MRAKLIAFPTVPKSERLANRCKAVAMNFDDPEIGVNLMVYFTRKMYESFLSQEADFMEMQILAKLMELENYLMIYDEQNAEPEGGGD